MSGRDGPEDDPPDGVWITYHMAPSDYPTQAVVMAVAAARNVPILDLEPLAETLDTDALDSLFRHSKAGELSPRVRFTYADCDIEVTNPTIRVRERG